MSEILYNPDRDHEKIKFYIFISWNDKKERGNWKGFVLTERSLAVPATVVPFRQVVTMEGAPFILAADEQTVPWIFPCLVVLRQRKVAEMDRQNEWIMSYISWIQKKTFSRLKIPTLTIPGFRSLRICADLQDFFCRVLQRSLHWILKIHTDLQDLYRSVQIFFVEMCFSSASKEPITTLTTSSTILADQGSVSWYSRSLKILSRRKICPHHSSFGDWRMRRIGYTP